MFSYVVDAILFLLEQVHASIYGDKIKNLVVLNLSRFFFLLYVLPCNARPKAQFIQTLWCWGWGGGQVMGRNCWGKNGGIYSLIQGRREVSSQGGGGWVGVRASVELDEDHCKRTLAQRALPPAPSSCCFVFNCRQAHSPASIHLQPLLPLRHESILLQPS